MIARLNSQKSSKNGINSSYIAKNISHYTFRPPKRTTFKKPSKNGHFSKSVSRKRSAKPRTWARGFVCPSCGHIGGWRLGDGRFKCPECGARPSATAGTIFDRTRTPLTVWFTACWLFATGKNGISALSLKRTLAIGSYQTAWAMLHRLTVGAGPAGAGSPIRCGGSG